MLTYFMDLMPDINASGKKHYYPRIDLQGKTTLNILAKSISNKCSLTESDVVGAIRAFTHDLVNELQNGRSVKIDGLGIFSATLGVMKKKELEDNSTSINAQSIEVRSVKFRPEKELIRSLNKNLFLERSKRKSKVSSSEFTKDERLALALQFISENLFMTVHDYCKLTGLLATAGSKELKEFLLDKSSGIITKGKGTHLVYCAQS